ncbi:MAG: hypothetical protein WDA09_10390 [Bacteriovoracaceae bacterium]
MKVGKSNTAISTKIKKLIHEGKPKNQAVAIAMAKEREDAIARMKEYRSKSKKK